MIYYNRCDSEELTLLSHEVMGRICEWLKRCNWGWYRSHDNDSMRNEVFLNYILHTWCFIKHAFLRGPSDFGAATVCMNKSLNHLLNQFVYKNTIVLWLCLELFLLTKCFYCKFFFNYLILTCLCTQCIKAILDKQITWKTEYIRHLTMCVMSSIQSEK